MTEKTTELKSAPFDDVSDPTVTDTASANPEENENTPPSDPDLLAVDPGKLSRFAIPYEMQQKMLQTKLPRLGLECFVDTVPPNKGLQAPTASATPTASVAPTPLSQDSQPMLIAKRRPPTGVVVACLVGVALILGLAIVRSSKRDPEPKPMMPGANETSTTPTATPVVASPAPELVVPPPPAISSGPAEHAVPTAPTKGTRGHRVPAHSPPDPSPVSKPTPPAQPDATAVPTVLVAPTPASPPHAAPVQSTWFDYK